HTAACISDGVAGALSTAVSRLMTLQARRDVAVTLEVDCRSVCIVALLTGQRVACRRPAAAPQQTRAVAGHSERFRCVCLEQKVETVVAQPFARAEGEFIGTVAVDHHIALEVALQADVIGPSGRQPRRIDDRIVLRSSTSGPPTLMQRHVLPSGAGTGFAANAAAGRQFVAVSCRRTVACKPAVTAKAAGNDRPVKSVIDQ